MSHKTCAVLEPPYMILKWIFLSVKGLVILYNYSSPYDTRGHCAIMLTNQSVLSELKWNGSHQGKTSSYTLAHRVTSRKEILLHTSSLGLTLVQCSRKSVLIARIGMNT